MADVETTEAMNEATAAAKLALRITTDAFDTQIQRLLRTALADMNIAGVDGENALISNDLVLEAAITYVCAHFGEPDEYERLKASYDEQKAQLSMSTGFTQWSAQESE